MIANFQSQDEDSPQVMLISLKSGAVGLNLTAASNVFLVSFVLDSAKLTAVRPVVAERNRSAGR